LTSPGCPMAGRFQQMVKEQVKKIDGAGKVSVELTFEPPWNEDLMSEEAKLELGI